MYITASAESGEAVEAVEQEMSKGAEGLKERLQSSVMYSEIKPLYKYVFYHIACN